MNMTKQVARLGIYFLKEAIIEVLVNAQDEEPLQLNEIEKRIGIPDKNESNDKSNALISNILFLLKSEGRIVDITEKGHGWIITEKGISLYFEKYHPMNL